MRPDFEWNPKKAERDFRKHEIGFEETCSIFDDLLFITVLDEEHTKDEERYITIGLSNKHRLFLVAHTDRNNCIRIISARKATKNEEKFYQDAG